MVVCAGQFSTIVNRKTLDVESVFLQCPGVLDYTSSELKPASFDADATYSCMFERGSDRKLSRLQLARNYWIFVTISDQGF